jgi:hypothetical protein
VFVTGIHFHPSPVLARSLPLKRSLGRGFVQAVPLLAHKNIRLVLKNTLTYHDTALITAVKKFCASGPCSVLNKEQKTGLFFSNKLLTTILRSSGYLNTTKKFKVSYELRHPYY